MTTEALFEETSAADRLAAVPLAHLSVELGHLYMEDLRANPRHLLNLMETVAPWVTIARENCARQLGSRPRISTCFLVDDYFTQLVPPDELIPQINEAAAAAGLQVDYLARESACVEADGVNLAMLVHDRLVPDPPPNTNGGRPPTTVSGWLCNGERSPQAAKTAMRRIEVEWQPPAENGANRHAIFVDVQLWDEIDGKRQWSCPYLAAIWQLLRLGVLRLQGRFVVNPRLWTRAYPQAWSDMPAVIQLSERPAPFAAYRTYSILPKRFLPIESAVRVIVSQIDIGDAMRAHMAGRAETELRGGDTGPRLNLPSELIDRMEYTFTGQPWLQ